MAAQSLAAQTGALQVVNLHHAALVPLSTGEVRDRLERYLRGSKFTPDDLLLGLADLMTHTPALKQCSPQSLFMALIFSASRHLNFGVGGVWLQPRDLKDPNLAKGQDGPKTKTAVPVMDYRAMEAIAADRHGIRLPLTTILVYSDEKCDVVMERGVIVDIAHKINPARNRTQVDFIWGYCVAERQDGSAPFIYIMDRESLEKRRKIGATDGDAWSKWGVEMYLKTLERKAMTVLVKDFTVGLATGDGGLAEEDGEPRDITEEVRAANAKPLTQSEQLKKDLAPPAQEAKQEEVRAGQDSTQPPPTVTQTKTDPDSPFHGYTDAELEAIRNSLAFQGAVADEKGSLKILMDWYRTEYPKWQAKGTAAQVDQLVKDREKIEKDLKQKGVK